MRFGSEAWCPYPSDGRGARRVTRAGVTFVTSLAQDCPDVRVRDGDTPS